MIDFARGEKRIIFWQWLQRDCTHPELQNWRLSYFCSKEKVQGRQKKNVQLIYCDNESVFIIIKHKEKTPHLRTGRFLINGETFSDYLDAAHTVV